ncbi:MAG: nuclear transport factor 2 family protein, partial [Gemmatimonadetes bacterium]|nr:nuclear transport factor 2 family protein [Gemmatimonadota bacterium]
DGMDVSGFVSLFTDDVVQHDVPRRVTVIGKDAWTTQTSQLNALHRVMSRTHHGRIQVGNLVIAEVQWTGTVRGAAFGTTTADRRYNYTGIVIMELDDGRIRRQLIYGDAPTLSAQLRLAR